MTKQKYIVVDGANIAYINKTSDGKPQVGNIIQVKKALEKEGFEPLIVVDASLYHDIDDPDQLDGLIDGDKIQQAPAGTDADYFVLKTAERKHAKVVTNDRYDEYQKRFPWFEKARVPVMIVGGEVILHEPSLKED